MTQQTVMVSTVRLLAAFFAAGLASRRGYAYWQGWIVGAKHFAEQHSLCIFRGQYNPVASLFKRKLLNFIKRQSYAVLWVYQ